MMVRIVSSSLLKIWSVNLRVKRKLTVLFILLSLDELVVSNTVSRASHVCNFPLRNGVTFCSPYTSFNRPFVLAIGCASHPMSNQSYYRISISMTKPACEAFPLFHKMFFMKESSELTEEKFASFAFAYCFADPSIEECGTKIFERMI